MKSAASSQKIEGGIGSDNGLGELSLLVIPSSRGPVPLVPKDDPPPLLELAKVLQIAPHLQMVAFPENDHLG